MIVKTMMVVLGVGGCSPAVTSRTELETVEVRSESERLALPPEDLSSPLSELPPDGGPRAGACVVRGASPTLPAVEVFRPDGQPLLQLRLHGTPVQAELPDRVGGRARISARGALSFRGQSAELTSTVVGPIGAADQMVRLAPGAQLRCAQGARGRTTCELYSERLGAARTIRPLSLPCDALTLDIPAEAADVKVGLPGDGTCWVPGDGAQQLTVHAEPHDRALAVALGFAGMSHCLVVERIKERNGFTQIADYGPGASLVGWVRSDALVPFYECLMFPRYGWQGGVGRMPASPPRRGIYEGPARIAIGTSVYAGAERVPWATVQTSEPLHVRHVAGDDWVWLQRVPGLSQGGDQLSEDSAQVPRAAVTFPSR